MLHMIYLLGFIVCFSYLSARLSRTIIMTSLNIRMIKALLFSIFWFITVPFSVYTGTFFRSQREFDEELYDKCVEDQIKLMLADLRKNGNTESEEFIRSTLKNEIGTIDDILSDMIYFSKSISREELAGLISYHYYKKNKIPKKHKDLGPEEFVLNHIDNLLEITDSVKQDVIGGDNLKTLCRDEFTMFKDLLGFHTLDNGLTFLGAISNSVYPFFFVIYYNGKELRAFVPKHNFYNKQTHKPFGVEEEDYIFFSSLTTDAIDRKKMYFSYKRKISPEKTLAEIIDQVNYLPKKGNLPEFGWNDINFDI